MLAGALKDEGFTVICTCPGWVDTDMGSRSDTKEVRTNKPTAAVCHGTVLAV